MWFRTFWKLGRDDEGAKPRKLRLRKGQYVSVKKNKRQVQRQQPHDAEDEVRCFEEKNLEESEEQRGCETAEHIRRYCNQKVFFLDPVTNQFHKVTMICRKRTLIVIFRNGKERTLATENWYLGRITVAKSALEPIKTYPVLRLKPLSTIIELP